MLKNGVRILMVALLAFMLLPAGLGMAEDEVFEGQASYWSPETAENGVIDNIAFDGDPHDLLFVVRFSAEGSRWVIVPEGRNAEDYLGKGIRYTVAEVVREPSDDHFEMVRAKTIEVFAESAEGTLKEIGDTEVVVDVTLGSSIQVDGVETMRFTITPETVIQMRETDGVGISIDVLYDKDMNALYIIQRNG